MGLEHLQQTLDRIESIRSRFEKPAAMPVDHASGFADALAGAMDAVQGDEAHNPQLMAMIDAESARQGLDPALVKSVVKAESGFNPSAVSPAGAMGLMQLMPATAKGLGVENPMDAEQNVRGGVKYLKSMIDRFQSVPLGLAAYNAGPGAVEKYGNTIPPYAETTRYVDKILKQYQASQANGGAL